MQDSRVSAGQPTPAVGIGGINQRRPWGRGIEPQRLEGREGSCCFNPIIALSGLGVSAVQTGFRSPFQFRGEEVEKPAEIIQGGHQIVDLDELSLSACEDPGPACLDGPVSSLQEKGSYRRREKPPD